MAGGGGGRGLDETPTWAAALFCGFVVAASLAMECILQRVAKYLENRRNKALLDALERVKTELMTLGFMSLLLAVAGDGMSYICIPLRASRSMMPCPCGEQGVAGAAAEAAAAAATTTHLRRRLSAGNQAEDRCMKKGMARLIPYEGMHQLHMFLFFLAMFHVAFSALTLYLCRAKMRIWKEWEKEASSPSYEFSCDPSKFKLAHQTSFVNQHATVWSKNILVLYTVSFFRQFIAVQRTDYLTIRRGFIIAHLYPGVKFDFQDYLKRSLEDDFKTVVHISVPLWASILVVLLASVHGWDWVFWVASTIRLVFVLAIGTKLQAIIATMAVEIKERHTVIQGMPVVKLSDEHFWFANPRLVLHLITFASFQNAFEITHFFWIWYDFGLRSCFHRDRGQVMARVCLGAVLQFVCCYITLPLYALVSQTGSEMKHAVLEEQTTRALEKWCEHAKKRTTKEHEGGNPKQSTTTAEGNWLEPPAAVPRLRRCITLAHGGGGGVGEGRKRALYDPAATMPRRSLGSGPAEPPVGVLDHAPSSV